MTKLSLLKEEIKIHLSREERERRKESEKSMREFRAILSRAMKWCNKAGPTLLGGGGLRYIGEGGGRLKLRKEMR